MSKQQKYLAEAEQLFVIEGCTLEVISAKTGVSTRTLQEWKAKWEWESKRTEMTKIISNSGATATSIAAKILERIMSKVEEDEELTPTEMLFVREFLPSRNKVKTQEEIAQDNAPKKTGKGVSQNVEDLFNEIFGR